MFLPSEHYLKLWKSWPTNLVMNNFKKFKFSIEHLKMFIYFLCRTLRLHLKPISLNNLKCFASSFRNLFECSGTFLKVPQEHSETFPNNWSWTFSKVLKLVQEHFQKFLIWNILQICSGTFSMFNNISKSSNWNSETFWVFTKNFKCCNWTFSVFTNNFKCFNGTFSTEQSEMFTKKI